MQSWSFQKVSLRKYHGKKGLEAKKGLEYPSQSRLIAARDQVPSLEEHQAIRAHLRKITVDLAAVFEAHDLDLIITPTDSQACSLAAASGTLLPIFGFWTH